MTTQHIIAAVFGAGLLTWLFWPALSALVERAGRWRAWSPPPVTAFTISVAPPVAVSDVSDLTALKQVEDRYKRLECNEGLAACQVLYAHFFHRGEHDA